MTACCCRLTQPETSRSRKASGRGSESMAEACRSGATRFKVRRLISWRSDTIFRDFSPGRVSAQHGIEQARLKLGHAYPSHGALAADVAA